MAGSWHSTLAAVLCVLTAWFQPLALIARNNDSLLCRGQITSADLS